MATNNVVSNTRPGFIVWEWLNDNGRWTPYDSSVTCHIESQYGTTSHVYLGTANQALRMYSVDISSMCQIRKGSGTARPIRRKCYPLTFQCANQIVWQWTGDSLGSWITYDFDVACLLEDCYTRGQKLLDLSATALHLPYYINLSAMQQVRIETGTVRGIRRQNLNVPYPLTGGTQTVQQAPMSLVSSSAAPPGAAKRTLANTSDSDSDGGQPFMANGSAGRKRPRKKQKFRSHATGSSNHGNLPSATATMTSVTHPNHVNPALVNNYSMLNILPPSTTSLLQLQGFVPSSSTMAFQPSMGGVGATLATGSGMNMFGMLPPNPSAPSAAMYQGPLTRSRHTSVTTAPSNMVLSASGFVPPSSLSMHFPNNLSMPVPAHMMTSAPNIPLQLTSGKNRGSSLQPVVSNMTSMLVSPAVPVAFTTHKSSAFAPPSSQSGQTTLSGRISLPKLRKNKLKTADEVLTKYLKVESKPPDEDCCICYDKLHEESSYGATNTADHQVVRLVRCGHVFHRMCLSAMYDSGHKDGSIQCPTCKTIYGERLGNCPPGEMDYRVLQQSLMGHPDCNTIRIMYMINPGTQGPEHPNPGKRYNARGFPRTAYLPDNEGGRKVLKLLILAWQRRLMFTVGVSTTTGEADTVTWNEIHHKTEFGSNVSGHGYPDPNYLDNVTKELAIQGVCEDDL